jgi:hypothetical protein
MAFPVFDKKEDIPKGFEEDYEEREGKFHPKIPDVTKQQTALETERKRAEDERKERVKAETALADLRRKEAARDGNISDEQLNKLREEDAAKRKAELDPVQSELTETRAKLRKVTLVDRLRALGTAAGWLPDRADDALEAALKRADLAEGSDSNIVVKDKEGKPTTEKIEDFLKTTFKKEKPWLYAGTGAAGSGAGGSNGSGGTPDGEEQERIAAKKRAQVQGAF